MRPTWNPVPWNRRALGWIIDFGIQTLLSWIAAIGMIASLVNLATSGSGSYPEAGSIGQLGRLLIWDLVSFASLIPAAYFQLYQRWIKGGPTGQSLGRRIAKTRLVDARTGQPIGIGMTIVRDLAHILDSAALYLGYLWPLWDKQRRTFADMLLTTVVVDENDAPVGVRR